jgi:CRP-like cAMP-binding protein
MNKTEASQVMQLILYNRYGTFLTLGEIGVLRKAEGKNWASKIYLAPDKDQEPIFIGVIETDSLGNLTSIFTKQDLIDKIKNSGESSESQNDEFGDFFMDSDEEDDEIDPKEIRNRIDTLLQQANTESLNKARGLYPLLLNDQSIMGATLHEMGLLEMAIENNDLALEYLGAAAREYSNLAKIDLIFKIADRVEKILGPKEFEKHEIYSLMKNTVTRMESINSLSEVRVFKGLPKHIIDELKKCSEEIVLDHREIIIREGDPAVNVVIIKQGLLDVVLEGFGNEPKTIRSCFPGEFLGENSVLSTPGSIQCTASLIASRENTTVWKFEGQKLIDLMEHTPKLANRINSIKELHQLDSFFSMHESMATMEVSTRDEILSCMNTIMNVSQGDELSSHEEIPENIYLIMSGQIDYEMLSGEKISFGPDHFICMRDALHGIAIEGKYVASQESIVAVFDAEKMRNFAVESSAAVVAVLERLN